MNDAQAEKIKVKAIKQIEKEVEALVQFQKRTDKIFNAAYDVETTKKAFLKLENDKYFNGKLLYTILCDLESQI